MSKSTEKKLLKTLYTYLNINKDDSLFDNDDLLQNIMSELSLTNREFHDLIKKFKANGYITGFSAGIDAQEYSVGFILYGDTQKVTEDGEEFMEAN